MSTGTSVCMKNTNFKTEIEHSPSFLPSQFDKKFQNQSKNSFNGIKQNLRKNIKNLVAFPV